MTDDKPTRRDLMKPVQLLGLAFGAALFAGVVTLVSMGFFQQRSPAAGAGGTACSRSSSPASRSSWCS